MKLTITLKRLACLVTLALAVLSMQAQTSTVKHTVDRGETLESIAKTYNTTIDEIVKLNPNAAQFIYVGMELTVPDRENSKMNNDSYQKTDNIGINSEYGSSKSVISDYNKQLNPNEEDLKDVFICLDWMSGSFEDIKHSGMYGIDIVAFPFHLNNKFSLGFNISPFNFNFGLVGKHEVSDLVKFGPAARFQINKNIFISFPIDVVCNITFDKLDSDEYGEPKLDKDGNYQYVTEMNGTWGMALSPNLHLGTSEIGVYLGPNMFFSFEKGNKPNFGFQIGLYFGK